jgi:hypothetical protein
VNAKQKVCQNALSGGYLCGLRLGELRRVLVLSRHLGNQKNNFKEEKNM